MKRAKNWLINILIVLGIVVGIGLIFNEQIKLFAIDHMTQTAVKQISAKDVEANKKRKATYNFKKVKALDTQTVAHAATSGDDYTIGTLKIPSVGMDLPILKGLSNDNLSIGAATMKEDQEMGQGNYALAGHYMTGKGILFSPLANVQVGNKIYLSDMKHNYVYKVTTKKVINETKVEVINDVKGKKLVTLITCASPTEGETNRILVQGTLIK